MIRHDQASHDLLIFGGRGCSVQLMSISVFEWSNTVFYVECGFI